MLPVVHRELRAAARRKATFRLRTWTAVVALLIGFGSLSFLWLARGPSSLGAQVFANMTGYAFALCLLAGVFLTADCLSQEKREGTLGLLFLTELRGYDVVAGKFMAMSLNALYGLLAIFPVLAIALLLGGVTGAEFWRMNAALLNALFVSLAGGLMVSALSRDTQRAMGGALALVLVLAAGLPGLARLLNWVHPGGLWPRLAWLSPFLPFLAARQTSYQAGPSGYWGALAASHLAGWCLLAIAGLAVQRTWQEKEILPRSRGWFASWKFWGGARQPWPSLHGRLIYENPVLRLFRDDSGMRALLWLIVGVWGLVLLAGCLAQPANPSWVLPTAAGFSFVLKCLLAVQACRFFAEGRRDGSLELLLTTPLGNADILRGQSLALSRTFSRPLLAFVGLGLMPAVVQVSLAALGGASPTLSSNLVGMCLFSLVAVGFFLLGLGLDSLALVWFGRWLALSSKNPAYAAPLTILFVLLIPSLFCSAPLFFSPCGLGLLTDIFFIAFGAARLSQDFRIILTRPYRTSVRPYPAPPVIAR
jgi:hypothetical protein